MNLGYENVSWEWVPFILSEAEIMAVNNILSGVLYIQFNFLFSFFSLSLILINRLGCYHNWTHFPEGF